MPGHVLESRIQQGQKLRALYRSVGWSRADCAKFLHVTERCLRNWETGRHPVPFAPLKLLRLHLGYELPGAAWRGWSISRGKLCTPEGHELDPLDAAWWSLLVRRAETGALALRQLHALKSTQRDGSSAAGVTRAGGPGAPVGGLAAPLAGAAGEAAGEARPLGLSYIKQGDRSAPSKGSKASK